MAKYKLEYVWLDGYKPQNLRSKTKIVDLDNGIFTAEAFLTIYGWDGWSFDGSSTKQAEGKYSDLVIYPTKIIKNPLQENAFIGICEVLDPKTRKPHSSNTRVKVDKDWWFGFEQEYVFYSLEKKNILGWPGDKSKTPAPQGKYYCGVGVDNAAGREITEEHLDACLKAGIDIKGVNAEVMLGQWEYQIFGKGTEAADDLWLSRYLLQRIAEKYGVGVDLRPKPMEGDWNGSGLHINFSNSEMRQSGGKELFKNICEKLKKSHKKYIKHSGEGNELRLTGKHETQHIDKFTYGESDRGASIRIPYEVVAKDYKGYLEDRRPAANADPYKLIELISYTLSIQVQKNKEWKKRLEVEL